MPDSLEYKPRSGTTGVGTVYDKNTYNVSSTMYPDDLMSDTDNRYGGNYVIFYINVRDDSKLAKEGLGDSGFVPADKVPVRQRGELSGANYSSATYTTLGAAAGAAAAQTGNVVAGGIEKAGVSLSKGWGVVANLAGGGLAGAALISAVGNTKNEYKRMRQAIALHIPTDLNIKYGMRWEETDLAGTNAMMSAAENTAKLSLGSVVGGTGSYLAGAALKTPGVGEAISKASGTSANPKKEQLFKQVDYRSFTFTYQFFPRSANEAKNVREIIKAFKFHMHPEYRDQNQFLYVYPSEFDIFYYQNGKENLNIHRHPSCVLTDMSVTYSPTGIFTTFDDGMPTQVNVTLTFMELALLSKAEIKDGF